jgi:hypothetical protein
MVSYYLARKPYNLLVRRLWFAYTTLIGYNPLSRKSKK